MREKQVKNKPKMKRGVMPALVDDIHKPLSAGQLSKDDDNNMDLLPKKSR